MIRVLVDIDILLDILLDRNPFAEEAYSLWEIIESKWIEAYVTPTTIEKIFCIAKKRQGAVIARKAISAILALIKICSVNDKDLKTVTSFILEQADLADLSEEDIEKLSERADEYEMYESEQVERAEAEERYWSDLIENFTQQAEEYDASSTQ